MRADWPTSCNDIVSISKDGTSSSSEVYDLLTDRDMMEGINVVCAAHTRRNMSRGREVQLHNRNADLKITVVEGVITVDLKSIKQLRAQ